MIAGRKSLLRKFYAISRAWAPHTWGATLKNIVFRLIDSCRTKIFLSKQVIYKRIIIRSALGRRCPLAAYDNGDDDYACEFIVPASRAAVHCVQRRFARSADVTATVNLKFRTPRPPQNWHSKLALRGLKGTCWLYQD